MAQVTLNDLARIKPGDVLHLNSKSHSWRALMDNSAIVKSVKYGSNATEDPIIHVFLRRDNRDLSLYYYKFDFPPFDYKVEDWTID